MSEQPRPPLDNLHSQLRSVLDAQIAAFTAEYDSAVEEARRSAAAAAEEALGPRIESAVADARRAAREEAEQALASQLEAAVTEARRASREEAEHALTAQIESAVNDARRAAREEAEQAFAPQLESLRTEWASRLESELAAARAEAERLTVTEAMKARVEAEQVAAESASRMRAELEQALAAERQRADAALRAERERAETELEELKRQVEDARETASRTSAAEAEAARVEREGRLAGVERLVRAMRALDEARSLAAALDTLLQHAATSAGRAVVFLVTGDRIKSWRTVGFPALDAQPFEAVAAGTGLVGQAIRTGDMVASGPGCPAPTFAALPPDRAAVAVPLMVGDRVVAAVYADNLGCAPDAPAAWADLVEAMARHTARVLGLVTATRTVQAMASQAGGASGTDGPVDEQSARRYARLLLSEIKLYNEPAVRLGREHRDLLQRLGGDIDRARRVYEERVPASLTSRLAFFQQELVQTLADGDPALLGGAPK